MRHQHKNKALDRKAASRKALLRGLVTNFVLYEKIKTTEAKAKVIKPKIERCITLAKKGDLNTRRLLKRYLYTEGSVKKMLEVIGPRYRERHGGYTRIIKIGPRKGDGAKIVQIELV